MANKMLIDATHPEETRVVVLRGNRVEEFDFETAQRKQLRGNIYLAKVTRVEPSLQAAFVDYGGNRHGFLAFSEIHPDYYQIPVADRQALIDEEGRAQRDAEDEADRRSRRHRGRGRPSAARRDEAAVRSELAEAPAGDAVAVPEHADALLAGEIAIKDEAAVEAEDTEGPTVAESPAAAESEQPVAADALLDHAEAPSPGETESEPSLPSVSLTPDGDDTETERQGASPASEAGEVTSEAAEVPTEAAGANSGQEAAERTDQAENGEDDDAAEEIVESVGGADALEEVPDRAPRYRRQYKIQEVIKRRQVMLVQVVKEERGTKGAALTTYLSLAGRYSVLMPNTARGGGISRKITNGEDRSRLKEIAQELEVPEGMGVIVRTAGASRTKTEIKRDFEYLLRLWETVRDLTLKSTAPKLVYEEGSLVKRSIRDLYSKEIDEVVVAGPEAYHEAKDFMRMLMPSHAKNVKLYADTQPLLSRYGVENQLDGMFSPVVQLRSGGYIVLNQAEALVAIDVNSGRATREHHIEDTALKTNLEASDEIARQLRLRDLAGLIVIDFIDMDENRNNRSVERRLKECLKQDRARIQVGRISHFGLLEMSRQRIRTSVLESSTEKCPYCGGSGHVRSVSSLALQVLRALEEQLMKDATHNLIARTRPDVALYVLNQKRAHLRGLEERFAITITISADETLTAPLAFAIDRGEQVHTVEAAKALAAQHEPAAAPLEEEDDLEEAGAAESEEGEAIAADASSELGEGGTRRRRRRRRRGRNGGETTAHAQPALHEVTADGIAEAAAPAAGATSADEDFGEEVSDTGASDRSEPQRQGEPRRRRRGRRGGRRNRLEREGEAAPASHDRGPREPQPALTTAEELTAPPATEPDLKEAVADLDAAPISAPPPAAPEPVEVATSQASAPPAQEPRRRRSTVREPAPISGNQEASQPAPTPPSPPAAQPVITEPSESEDTNRPRRSGWWSRRIAGG
ncbi:MAG TPA: Rne/Rng family ribonuclease [Xanthobacteraceae bacterium]|nr:Rne/Rng family ribonuclease [Xanthobacteraceae bacterium]